MEHWAIGSRVMSHPGAASGAASHPDPTTDERRGADRRRRRMFVLRERRSGFDRRMVPPSGGDFAGTVRRSAARLLLLLRDRPVLLLGLIVSMNVLSLCDLALTLRSLEQGAVELNPVIKPLLDHSPWLAGLVKVLLVGTASLLIWRFRRYKMVLQVALLGPFFFGLISLYQVTFSFIIHGS